MNIPYKRTLRGEVPNLVVDANGQVLQEATGTDPYVFDSIWEFYMEPDPEETVILFLSDNQAEDRYFPAIEPFTIALEADGCLALRSNLLLPEAELREKLETPFQTEGGKTLVYQIEAAPIQDSISGMTLPELLEMVEQPENPSPDGEISEPVPGIHPALAASQEKQVLPRIRPGPLTRGRTFAILQMITRKQKPPLLTWRLPGAGQ